MNEDFLEYYDLKGICKGINFHILGWCYFKHHRLCGDHLNETIQYEWPNKFNILHLYNINKDFIEHYGLKWLWDTYISNMVLYESTFLLNYKGTISLDISV